MRSLWRDSVYERTQCVGQTYVLTDKMTEDSYPELLKVLLTSCRHKLE